MKTITLNGQVYRLDATPSSFSWTPAMSAIWPAEYRPTMSGLLAIWAAMHEAAEYADISQYASFIGSTTDPDKGYDPASHGVSQNAVAAPKPEKIWVANVFGSCPVSPDHQTIDIKLRNGVVYECVIAKHFDHLLFCMFCGHQVSFFSPSSPGNMPRRVLMGG